MPVPAPSIVSVAVVAPVWSPGGLALPTPWHVQPAGHAWVVAGSTGVMLTAPFVIGVKVAVPNVALAPELTATPLMSVVGMTNCCVVPVSVVYLTPSGDEAAEKVSPTRWII